MVYGVSASWHAVFDLRQVIRLSWHSDLPDIVEQTNNNTGFFTYLRREVSQGVAGAAEIWQGVAEAVGMDFRIDLL